MYLPCKSISFFACVVTLSLAAGCGDEGGSHNESEVITTVTLTFTPSAAGTPVVAAVNDPDGDGGNPPTIDPVNLAAGMFGLTVKFENRLEMPPEDITAEVMGESHEHQIFFTGTAVNGPASSQPGAPLTQTYGDTDTNGLPIGLANTMAAARGAGMLTVTLRHLPPVNGHATKTAALATTVRDTGFAAIGGSTDAQVTFPVTVQ